MENYQIKWAKGDKDLRRSLTLKRSYKGSNFYEDYLTLLLTSYVYTNPHTHTKKKKKKKKKWDRLLQKEKWRAIKREMEDGLKSEELLSPVAKPKMRVENLKVM